MLKLLCAILKEHFFGRFRQVYRDSPNKWTMASLKKELTEGPFCSFQGPDGNWYPSRPCGMDTVENRAKLALAVFEGRADALFWEFK